MEIPKEVIDAICGPDYFKAKGTESVNDMSNSTEKAYKGLTEKEAAIANTLAKFRGTAIWRLMEAGYSNHKISMVCDVQTNTVHSWRVGRYLPQEPRQELARMHIEGDDKLRIARIESMRAKSRKPLLSIEIEEVPPFKKPVSIRGDEVKAVENPPAEAAQDTQTQPMPEKEPEAASEAPVATPAREPWDMPREPEREQIIMIRVPASSVPTIMADLEYWGVRNVRVRDVI